MTIHPVLYTRDLQCFEGMKAYRDADGNVRLFRPDLNIKRLNRSMQRLRFPQVDEASMIELIRYESTAFFSVLVPTSSILRSVGTAVCPSTYLLTSLGVYHPVSLSGFWLLAFTTAPTWELSVL